MGKNIDESTVLKGLEALSDEEKVKKLVAKLVESEKSNANLKAKVPEMEKLNKLKDSLEKKLEKSNQILLRTEESKSKLEELCRGLQKLNHQIRDESVAKVKKLELERQEAVEQLKVTLKDIENSMSAGKEKSDLLADDNRKLAEKFTELGKQYEERLGVVEDQYAKKEKYWEEYSKAKDIEIKLLAAKLEAASINTQRVTLEKDALAKTVIEETARVGGALQTEKILRDQVKNYADKYADLTDCLAKSNETFDKFKKEIERVNANCKKVETDVFQWRKKYEEANQKVLVLTITNQEYAEKIAHSDRKIGKLEGLCRALRKDPEQATDNATNGEQVEKV